MFRVRRNRAHTLGALLSLVLVLANGAATAAPLRFAYGPAPHQFGELTLPDGPGPFPVAVLIHGGCWQSTLPGVELMRGVAEDLAHQGYATWNVDYRRLGDAGAGYPGTFSDSGDALDYLRKLTPTYPLDLGKVITIGHSAGGTLALWVAARPRFSPQNVFYRDNPVAIRAAITLGGIDDLRAYHDSDVMACGGPGTIDVLLGAGGRRGHDVYADTSPAALLPLHVAQIILSGTEDKIVPSSFGASFGADAQKAGDAAEVIDIEGANHFDLIDPHGKAWASVRDKLLRLK